MEPKQIQVRASDQDLKGGYSNVAKITHSQEEFILDFFSLVENTGTLVSRVILSPGHMKRFVHALEENLKNYEGRFGTVALGEVPPTTIGF